MNRLSVEKRANVIRCLVEGNSIRSTSRITGASKNTITKLLVDIGKACREYQDKHLRNLTCKRIQVDEIWAFCYAKQKNVPDEFKGVLGYGDVWTFTSICAESKLVPSWMLGWRDANTAYLFMNDLSSRMKHRIQLTTDGLNKYFDAVTDAFTDGIDYAMLIKLYGASPEGEKRYSPRVCIGTEVKKISGNPDPKHVSTSYVERNNLTMRMGMRRFTRLTNGFSKKLENLEHSVSLHFMYYNFVRIHKAHGVTPAMAAGVIDRLWEIEDIVRLI